MSLELTVESLRKAEFRGPVAFYDGRDGMARQDYECVAEPRFGYFWRRENRRDKGRQAYMVDGAEVANLEEACARLALPANPNSPAQVRRREFEDMRASPKLNRGATRALNDAQNNAAAGVFGQVRAWVERAAGAWHWGVNRWNDAERADGRDFAHWPYNAMSAAHETYRGVYLFEHDALEDTGLTCARGVKCRDCAILRTIDATMRESQTREPFPSAVEEQDIVGAKVWTCVAHVLSGGDRYVLDGAFWSTKRDRG